MALKPEQARHAFLFGMVLAMAVTILALVTWVDRDLAQPSSSPIYQSQLCLCTKARPPHGRARTTAICRETDEKLTPCSFGKKKATC
jgi:hypothetical protein